MATTLTNKDPFNWPMPNRCDSMSLSSINFAQDNVRAAASQSFLSKRRESTNLTTSGISGATPKVFIPKEVNNPGYQNSNGDIMGSKPRQLHVGLENRKTTNLDNSDIKGSKPNLVKFKTQRVPQNPLNPEYKLQSVKFVEPPVPRFVRDQMAIDDIEGSKPKVKMYLKTRDLYNVEDIVGAKPKTPMTRKQIHDQIFTDVYKKKMLNKEPQNPLEPNYKIKDENGTVIDYGKIEGSTVKKPYYRKNVEEANMNLKSRDIHGNLPGSRALGNFHTRERRQIKAIGRNDDIMGSKPGSLARGIKVPPGHQPRVGNPLDPEYQLLGNQEESPTYNPEACSMNKASIAKRVMHKAKAMIPKIPKPMVAKTSEQNIVEGSHLSERSAGKKVLSENGSTTAGARIIRPVTAKAASERKSVHDSNRPQTAQPNSASLKSGGGSARRSIKSNRPPSGVAKSRNDSARPGAELAADVKSQGSRFSFLRKGSGTNISRPSLTSAQKLDQYITK